MKDKENLNLIYETVYDDSYPRPKKFLHKYDRLTDSIGEDYEALEYEAQEFFDNFPDLAYDLTSGIFDAYGDLRNAEDFRQIKLDATDFIMSADEVDTATAREIISVLDYVISFYYDDWRFVNPQTALFEETCCTGDGGSSSIEATTPENTLEVMLNEQPFN